MKVGYARVSSQGQSLDTQIEKLEAFGCEKVFQEKRSGASRSKREAVNAALEYCREGDVLVITKLDRLARSMFDLQGIVQELERKKVDFVVLDQKIDTTTPTGRLTFHLLGAVAESWEPLPLQCLGAGGGDRRKIRLLSHPPSLLSRRCWHSSCIGAAFRRS